MLSLKSRLHGIIFEADTKAGFIFDVVLMCAILLSVLTVMLESIADYQTAYKEAFFIAEIIFTVVFTLEYLLRIWVVARPRRYITSFFGLVDLISIIPSYLSLVFVGTQYLLVIRALRLLRVFRILKLAQFNSEAGVILGAMQRSRHKITVFLLFIILMCTIIGSTMYLVEGSQNPGFANIPVSIYWTIVTLTTVGFGDITPKTPLGQFLSALIMILGYAVIAVPTGIVSAEMATSKQSHKSTQVCRHCFDGEHEEQAKFCKSCGHSLDD